MLELQAEMAMKIPAQSSSTRTYVEEITAAVSNVFESIKQLPRGWSFIRKANGTEPIKLRISLKQQNVDHFYEKLLEVSTPDHPNYGMHYEGHELRSLLQPREESSRAAINWLSENNITTVKDEGDYLLFSTDVFTANRILRTEFGYYQARQTKQQVLRARSYSVPDEVREHINFVQPITRFGGLKPLSSMARILDEGVKSDGVSKWWGPRYPQVNVTCNTTITPECLLNLYNVHYDADPDNGNTVGYASFLEEYARFDDLNTFEKVYAPYAVNKTFNVTQYHGGLNNQTAIDDSGEANLDNQYILSVSYPTPVTEFSTGGRGLLIPDGDSPTAADNTNEPYLDFLLALTKLSNDAIPNSISLSYGENEQEIPTSYATQVCNLFAQLGARGKTILFSSGDSGPGDFCLSNDGKNATKFQPSFPATCPWVTAVGGTAQIEPEVAVSFSSGGFSDIWPRPAYQEWAVDEYLKKVGSKNKGWYNPKGRGFPDVAAQALNFRVIDKGNDAGYMGTSCAAPTFNAIIALLNSARVDSGLPTLGFLNPWLYSTGRLGLNDITKGRSEGCDGFGDFHRGQNGSPVLPGAGWNASVGWDAVTGLGTPDFGKLLRLSTPWARNDGGVLDN
ncbi:putative Tripeptidyl-peptidase sed2 [Stipitochalara longipes BDJ]|nr:putative Tripeptidyl-peptidase sed2 [Stipitochalara longipes BDJ]